MKDEADNRTLDWIDIEEIRRNKPEGSTHYAKNWDVFLKESYKHGWLYHNGNFWEPLIENLSNGELIEL